MNQGDFIQDGSSVFVVRKHKNSLPLSGGEIDGFLYLNLSSNLDENTSLIFKYNKDTSKRFSIYIHENGFGLWDISKQSYANLRFNYSTAIGLSSFYSPAVIVETYVSGLNWYRIWSDGWVEQGGFCVLNASWSTFTFLIPFKDTNYTIIAQPINALGTAYFDKPVCIARRSNTQFDSGIYSGQTSWGGSWYACGLKA